MIALVAPVAAGDVIAAAFVRSALSVSLLDVSVPLATRVMPTAVYSLVPVAPGSAVCHDANRATAEALSAASFHALSPLLLASAAGKIECSHDSARASPSRILFRSYPPDHPIVCR